MNVLKPSRLFLSTAFVFLLGCAGSTTLAPAIEPIGLTGVTQTLIELLDKQDKAIITAEDYQSTSLHELIQMGTPAGYRLKLRYLSFGVSLVEALKAARDQDLRKRLIEMVQWSRNPTVRAEAIVTLASLYDPAHRKFLKEALLDSKVGIRFAAVEALQLWGQPEAVTLLKMAMGRDWSPLMQVFAAQALLALGDQSGLDVLWKGLDHQSWVVRAMSARYLGDYAAADDYTKLSAYLNRENKNDFVIAELSLAALKLISKKGEKVSYSPASKEWKEHEEVKYHYGKDNVIDLEPLIIVPPQLRIPPSHRVAAKINTELLRLIRDRLDTPLDKLEAQDPILEELNSMVTPTGFALKTRYAELSYLVVEALGGTSDLLLRAELQRLARDAANPLVKANALIALAYSRNDVDLYLIQEAINHKSPIVRMGAMEAIEVGRFKAALPSVLTIAGADPSHALQIYAMHVLAKFGHPSGYQLLLGRLSDTDWPARAMAFWYMGRYGTPQDYTQVQARLVSEDNPFVKSEIALACLRLTPLE